MPTPLMTDKVVFVTGGGSGIGAAVARLSAEEGAEAVIVTDRDADSAESVAKAINAELGHEVVKAFGLDVTNRSEVDAIVARIEEHHGRLDCALNNAGVSGPRTWLGKYTDEDFHEVMKVNLDGLFFCLRAELSTMQRARSGSIVNIASGATIEPPPGLAPYAASKSGVIAMTKSVAGEYGRDGIRVNSVLPGKVLTKLLLENFDEARLAEIATTLPMGRIGEPRELAEGVVWLFSDRSSYVNGADLLIDGGAHAASRISEIDRGHQ
jgi:NAD(P)-dependent dehydrogenase (short-subunit alcohol dehydrogenase family)